MTLIPVKVQARWLLAGGFEPERVSWDGETFVVASSGRSWEDEDGLHLVCMILPNRVVELIFHLHPAGWVMRLPPENQTAWA